MGVVTGPRGSVEVPVRPVLWPGIGVFVVVLVLGSLLAGVIDSIEGLRSLPGRDAVVNVLDLNQEASFGTWVAVVYTAVLSAVVGVLGLRREGAARRAWWTLGTLLVLVSIDEVTTMHERLSGLLEDRLGIDKVLWVVPVGVVGLIVIAVLVRAMREAGDLPTVPVLVGLGLMALGALGFELLSSGIDGREAGWSYWLQSTAEEALELGGLAVLCRAVVDHTTRAGLRFVLHD